jgi:phage shock protein C
MVGGVCAGLGEYLNADPTIIRLVFVLLTLAGFSGVLIYLVMWLVVPAK